MGAASTIVEIGIFLLFILWVAILCFPSAGWPWWMIAMAQALWIILVAVFWILIAILIVIGVILICIYIMDKM